MMPQWNYVLDELKGRRRRSGINVSLMAISVGLFLILNAAAGSIETAFRQPLLDVGADLTVQRSGDVPEKMEGPVLPCSVAPLKPEEIEWIRSRDGVLSVSPGLVFWDFGPKDFRVAAGFDPGDPAGFSLLGKTLTSGRFLSPGETGSALLEKSYAQNTGLAPGDTIDIGGRSFQVAGTVDASLVSHLVEAQVYLALGDARRIAVQAPGVRAVHQFGPFDANLLFIKAHRDKVADLQNAIKARLGQGVTVTGPESFRESIGSLFALTDRFSKVVSLLALVIAAVLVARTTAANVSERRREIGVMKAVGWRKKDIISQIGAETLVQVFLGALMGIVIALAAAKALSLVEIAIPIPWDMSPRPHFLPGGGDQLYRNVLLPVILTPAAILTALASAAGIGLMGAWFAAGIITRLKSSEALRYE